MLDLRWHRGAVLSGLGIFWKRSVSRSCLGVFLFCFVLVCCLCCFVNWRHLAFLLTYSPTCGNSQFKTKRFDDRLSLERARHELNSGWCAMRNLDVSSLVLPHHCVLAYKTFDVAMVSWTWCLVTNGLVVWNLTQLKIHNKIADDSSYNAVSQACGAEPWCGFGF